ncbi:MAG: hypothetical protein MHM6MM_001119 [Cercozoa sp. M6MM]
MRLLGSVLALVGAAQAATTQKTLSAVIAGTKDAFVTALPQALCDMPTLSEISVRANRLTSHKFAHAGDEVGKIIATTAGQEPRLFGVLVQDGVESLDKLVVPAALSDLRCQATFDEEDLKLADVRDALRVARRRNAASIVGAGDVAFAREARASPRIVDDSAHYDKVAPTFAATAAGRDSDMVHSIDYRASNGEDVHSKQTTTQVDTRLQAAALPVTVTITDGKVVVNNGTVSSTPMQRSLLAPFLAEVSAALEAIEKLESLDAAKYTSKHPLSFTLAFVHLKDAKTHIKASDAALLDDLAVATMSEALKVGNAKFGDSALFVVSAADFEIVHETLDKESVEYRTLVWTSLALAVAAYFAFYYVAYMPLAKDSLLFVPPSLLEQRSNKRS